MNEGVNFREITSFLVDTDSAHVYVNLVNKFGSDVWKNDLKLIKIGFEKDFKVT